MLTSKQRAQLRKLANPINDTLHIGKDGVTDGVVAQLEVLLENHELVKGKVLENALLTPRTVAEALCEDTGAESVQIIGTKFVLYRPSPDPDKRNIVLDGDQKKRKLAAAKPAVTGTKKVGAKSAGRKIEKSTGKKMAKPAATRYAKGKAAGKSGGKFGGK